MSEFIVQLSYESASSCRVAQWKFKSRDLALVRVAVELARDPKLCVVEHGPAALFTPETRTEVTRFELREPVRFEREPAEPSRIRCNAWSYPSQEVWCGKLTLHDGRQCALNAGHQGAHALSGSWAQTTNTKTVAWAEYAEAKAETVAVRNGLKSRILDLEALVKSAQADRAELQAQLRHKPLAVDANADGFLDAFKATAQLDGWRKGVDEAIQKLHAGRGAVGLKNLDTPMDGFEYAIELLGILSQHPPGREVAPPGCDVSPISSRGCELGTKGCTVQHGDALCRRCGHRQSEHTVPDGCTRLVGEDGECGCYAFDDGDGMHRGPCQDVDGSGACYGCGRWLGDSNVDAGDGAVAPCEGADIDGDSDAAARSDLTDPGGAGSAGDE